MPAPVVMSCVWFFCLGGLGIFFPFFSLYLGENAGLSGPQMGLVLSMLPLIGTLAQPFWGQLADRTGSRSRVLALLVFGAAAGYLSLGFAQGFPALLIATMLLALFSTAMIPTAMAVSFALAQGDRARELGRMRVWGTVGFLLLVVGFPPLLHQLQAARGLVREPGGPSEPGLGVMFPVTAAVLLVGALIALALPRGGEMALRAPKGDWRRLMLHRPFVRLLAFSLFAYACLQGPMSIFPIYVRSLGGTLDSVSQMWILMLALEIPLVFYSGSSIARFGPRGLLAIGVLAGGVRWTACGLAPDLAFVYPFQLLHGVVVAGLVVGGPLYVEAVVPERLRSTGQGMLAMVGVSVGAVASQLGTGVLLELGGPRAPYLVGGIGALALAGLLPWLLPPVARPAPAPDEEERL
jgi:MFS transporter, PPP family, 3-phenylpropionic acid transporter